MRNMAEWLIKRYDTRNPFEIAKLLHIAVIEEPLGPIRGYYSQSHRQKFIHINNNLDDSKRLFTCAHELGHAVLHAKENTPFLRNNTCFSVNRLELEANRFAVDLIISDDMLSDYADCTISQLSQAWGIDQRLIAYRLHK